VVNLLALALFTAWLWQSGRLNRQRIDSVRDMLAHTIAEDVAEMEAAAAESKRDHAEAAENARRANPPLPSAAQVNEISVMNTREYLTLRRLEDEKNMLVEQLRLQSQRMQEELAAFESQRAQWEQATRADRDRQADEQFQKTVKLYESLPAKQSKAMLVELVDRNATPQAIAYLDAMDPRAAAKILRELKTDTENKLATELLENLRTFGLTAEDAKEAGNADHAQPNSLSAAKGP
jgi:hypothetical protein